jgi:hypothetical protein
METRRITVGTGAWTVRIDGPQSRHAVLLLPDAGDPVDVYDRVNARLHTSDLRTIAVEDIEGLDQRTALGMLDQLGIPWAVMAGCGAGAELAWQLAARSFGRFIGLVAAGRGHPAAAGTDSAVADPSCPVVEIPTTVVATKALSWQAAQTSARHVFGEFRVAQVDVTDVATEADHEFATEIVLRTGQW